MLARLRRRSGMQPTRRSWRAVVAAVVGLLVVALVVGEVANDVVDSSRPVDLMEQRSYVAAVVPVIDESTALVPWLEAVRTRPASLGRDGLEAALGRLVSGALDVRQQLTGLGIPPPTAPAGAALDEVVADRLRAARDLAAGVGLVLSGSPGAEADDRLAEAGRAILASDVEYTHFASLLPRRVRRHTARLPHSSWAASLKWSSAALDHFALVLSLTPSLARRVGIEILALTVEPPVLRITPTTTTTTTTSSTTSTTSSTTTTTTTTFPGAPSSTSTTTTTTTTTLPPTTTTTTLQLPPADSTSWLAPTHHLTAVVVVANGGDVSVRDLRVEGRLVLLSRPKRASSKRRTARLLPETVHFVIAKFPPGASEEVILPRFSVAVGGLYRLTVSVSGGAHSRRTASQSVRIDIAGP